MEAQAGIVDSMTCAFGTVLVSVARVVAIAQRRDVDVGR